MLHINARLTYLLVDAHFCFFFSCFFSCDCMPACNLTRTSKTYNGISFFLDSDVQSTPDIYEAANLFSQLLSGLARDVFHIPPNRFHMYLDLDGAKIAFNDAGSVFFNLRYYMQVHMKQQEQVSLNTSISTSACSFWYVTSCHELAHHTESGHNSQHEDAMETLLSECMENFIQYITTNK
jgi:hypothetical protein